MQHWKSTAFPDLPIIGQTAHALVEERTACFVAGMVDHVSKPIDPDTLFAIILKHARRSSGSGLSSPS